MIDIRDAGALGKGVFAKVDIAKGTCILSEEPLLYLPLSSPTIGDICTHLHTLSEEALKAVDELTFNPETYNAERTAKAIQAWHARQLRPGAKPNNEHAQDTMRKRYAIFITNSSSLGLLGGKDNPKGLFKIYSRINHSCTPNVYSVWHAKRKCLLVHAGRDIQAGEQLVTSYLGAKVVEMSRQQRREALVPTWGFACRCEACADTTGKGDETREDIGRLLKSLAEACESPVLDADFTHRSTRASVATKAIQDAKHIIVLMEGAGLGGWPLCQAYEAVASFCTVLDNAEEAICFTQKNLELQRDTFGQDMVDKTWILDLLPEATFLEQFLK